MYIRPFLVESYRIGSVYFVVCCAGLPKQHVFIWKFLFLSYKHGSSQREGNLVRGNASRSVPLLLYLIPTISTRRSNQRSSDISRHCLCKGAGIFRHYLRQSKASEPTTTRRCMHTKACKQIFFSYRRQRHALTPWTERVTICCHTNSSISYTNSPWLTMLVGFPF